MKFQIAINLERMNDNSKMQDVAKHTIDMVKMADESGFEIAWAAEHHALEMTIAPNPFQLLTWWAAHTENIRLGCGVANASYWHPINIAGEAAMVDLISGGRLEMGLGSGAYQREFDRMKPGLLQTDGWQYMQEMLPLLPALWAGDVAHEGKYWQFPKATSCPKPVQENVPLWVAARSPITFDYAVKNNFNILSWPLTKPFAEAELYRTQLDEAMAANGGSYDGRFVMMRHTSIYANEEDRQHALDSVRVSLSQFGNLMMKKGDVNNGFPDQVPLESLDGNAFVDPDTLEENLLFGTPEAAIKKLKAYESLGLDGFIYYASMGLGMEQQKRSLQLFIDEVMPEFA